MKNNEQDFKNLDINALAEKIPKSLLIISLIGQFMFFGGILAFLVILALSFTDFLQISYLVYIILGSVLIALILVGHLILNWAYKEISALITSINEDPEKKS